GVPLIDWFGSEKGQLWPEELRASYKNRGVRTELLTPNLPNRFLALVPRNWKNEAGKSIDEVAKAAVREAWEDIAGEVHDAVQKAVGEQFPGWDRFWNAQTARFPVADFIVHDWEETATVLESVKKGEPPLHGGWENHPLRHAIEWATRKIPDSEKDARCYPFNPGFVWAVHYAATEWRFAAVKSARPFAPWTSGAGVEKDHLDGRNEVLGGKDHDAFWNAMRGVRWTGEAPANLFKGRQEYGALTTVKRLFPFVWLPGKLDTGPPRFDSVQDIAEAIESEEESDAHYAILCMDGDDMGSWVGGSRTPLWKNILSGSSEDPKTPLGYFRAKWGKQWDTVRAPLTPSFHAALSEALGNYSLYCAGQIIDAFGGQLLYAGGDDVLAMLPADQAVDCADALQLVFRGIDPSPQGRASRTVQQKLSGLFTFPAPGFVRCLKGTGAGEHCRPNWPVMVPGPHTTASIGIAVGHVRSPMQDVIQGARDAERDAKKVSGKGALALRILKRSGEAVGFSAGFDSGAQGIWAELTEYRETLSSRFIHRFLRKLKPVLATVRDGRAAWEADWMTKTGDLRTVVEAELLESLKQQSGFAREEIQARAERWTHVLTSSL
ncbi:MAG: type III-B CRISPR-associated protein Cas10/Cmr2, partial [Verrucomicrobiaceae bacterium]